MYSVAGCVPFCHNCWLCCQTRTTTHTQQLAPSYTCPADGDSHEKPAEAAERKGHKLIKHKALQSAALSLKPYNHICTPDHLKALAWSRRYACHKWVACVLQAAQSAVHRLGCLDDACTMHNAQRLVAQANSKQWHIRKLPQHIQAHTYTMTRTHDSVAREDMHIDQAN